jgi:hypothetical protein
MIITSTIGNKKRIPPLMVARKNEANDFMANYLSMNALYSKYNEFLKCMESFLKKIDVRNFLYTTYKGVFMG